MTASVTRRTRRHPAKAAIIRKVVTAALLLQACITGASQTLDFDGTHYDFGDIAESGKTVSHRFRFTNNGNAPLVIYGTVSSCGCTAAEYTARPVAPGDTGHVKVIYTAEGYPGRFVRGIRVKSNIPPGETLLTVEGNVIRDDTLSAAGYVHEINGLRLTAENVLFGNVIQGEEPCRTIMAVNGSDRPVSITFPCSGGRVKAAASPAAAEPGEKTTITLCYDSSGAWGEERGGIAICIGSTTETVTDTIRYAAEVKERFGALTPEKKDNAPAIEVSTRALNAGELEREKPFTENVTVSNTGKSTLHIRKIESSSPCVSATAAAKEIESGESSLVTVTVNGGKLDKSRRLLNERIRIITDDPVNPETQIQITASFR